MPAAIGDAGGFHQIELAAEAGNVKASIARLQKPPRNAMTK
jgi:hypothetical protein